ncbi:MAG: hypothetical protein AAF206_13645 [Bacteroidota bacterium]
MTSFQSKYYPKTRNGLRVLQEHAMQYYAAFNLVIMVGVLVNVISGGGGFPMLWAVVIAEIFAVAVGTLLAYVQLRKRYAQIFFVNEHFSLISVYEILFQRENNAFPLIYASPSLNAEQDQLTIHFNDQVITLHRDDWEDFDLIRDWLFSRQL